MEYYFETPYFRDLTKLEGWEDEDGKGVKYQVARAKFKMVISHMPGSSKIGRKFEPTGAPGGVSQDRIREHITETETFDEYKSIERSIIESNSMAKVLSSLSSSFGDGKVFKFGGKISAELSESIKSSFQNDFHITSSVRQKKTVRYEFRDTVSDEFTERVCGVAVYQQCRADLYLLKVDFLNVSYEKTYLGLRKKRVKDPFPSPEEIKDENSHPNVIHIGEPVAELRYWELLPMSSVLIKDSDYVQEVENDADITIHPPRSCLGSRPYWSAKKSPTLYHLSNISFPYKWVNKKNGELTKEELEAVEIGEAVGSGWWFQHGPGRNANK